MTNDISNRARFDQIRYAQVWEDADVLLGGMRVGVGDRVLSIASAGDNVLATLTRDPASVVAVDLSEPQIFCLHLRMAAYRQLTHAELLELMGSRQSARRGELLDKLLSGAEIDPRMVAFWTGLRDEVIAYGLGGVGKFERYFRLFRTRVLPLVHSRATIDALLTGKPREERARFFERRWNNLRWRLMLKLFFSGAVMGRLGRDPAFFEHAEGSLSDQVAHRTRHALVELDPHANPYLHWILKGTHGEELPAALREENFELIRDRLDRITIVQAPIESLSEMQFDAFNLSDVFEYMDEDAFASLYGTLLDMARPGARLVYWNMLVPRSLPARYKDRVEPELALAEKLHADDKAFFYSNLIVERVK